MSIRDSDRCRIRSVTLWDWQSAKKFLTQCRGVSKRKEMKRNIEKEGMKRNREYLWLR